MNAMSFPPGTVAAFCARRSVNPATAEKNGVCEDRVVRLGGPYVPHDQEVMCAECGRVTVVTWGVHGDAMSSDGRTIEPDPEDPRNRGYETGFAIRALRKASQC